MSDAFWHAVDTNNVATVADLLKTSPALVNEQYRGEAWKPKHIWSPEFNNQVTAPPDFSFTNTALHTAAVNGRTELADLLLANGADVNAMGFEPNKGLTPPVVLAAWEGTLETLRTLLVHGADPNIAASAETALYTAAEHRSDQKCQLLLAHGARHDIFTAAILGDVQTAKRLLLAYPSLREARSLKRGRTPAEEAAHHNQTQVLQLFQQWQ